VSFPSSSIDASCIPASLATGHGSCFQSTITNIGMPSMASGITVGNPKDVVTAAMPNVDILATTILARQVELITGAWWGPTDDIIQVSEPCT
jgi:glucan 1,3-beta-glucosidase